MALTRWLLVVLALALPSLARAQRPEGPDAVRSLAACIAEHQTHLERLVRLIGEAEERLGASDPAVSADARTALVTLVQRAHDVREHLRRCVDAARIPTPGAASAAEDPPTDPTAESLAEEHGTVHEVERDVELADGVRVVHGERIDGTGEASDRAVQAAMRGVASRLLACRADALDRGDRGAGEVHVVFTVGAGGRATEVEVEHARGVEGPLRSCVAEALAALRVEGARGRSTFGYTLRFGED